MLSPKDLDVPLFEDFWWNDETSDGDDKKGSGQNGGESPRTATGEETGFEDNITQKPKEFESLVFGDGVSTERESGTSTISTDIYSEEFKPKIVEKHLDMEFLLKNKSIRALHDKTLRTIAKCVLVNEITLKSITKSIKSLFEQTPGVVLSSHDVVNILFCLHVNLYNVPATNSLKSDIRKNCSTALTILSSTSYLHTAPTAHRRNPGYVLPQPDTPASRLQQEFVLRCRLARRIEGARTKQTRLSTVCRRLVDRLLATGGGGHRRGRVASGARDAGPDGGKMQALKDCGGADGVPLGGAKGVGWVGACACERDRGDESDGESSGLTGGGVDSEIRGIQVGGWRSDEGMKAGKYGKDEASKGFDRPPSEKTIVSCWSRVQDRRSQDGGSNLKKGGEVR